MATEYSQVWANAVCNVFRGYAESLTLCLFLNAARPASWHNPSSWTQPANVDYGPRMLVFPGPPVIGLPGGTHLKADPIVWDSEPDAPQELIYGWFLIDPDSGEANVYSFLGNHPQPFVTIDGFILQVYLEARYIVS